MKTEFRITTIIFALVMLCVFASVPVIVLSKDAYNLKQLSAGVIVFLVFFSCLVVGGVVGIIWLTLRIDIDQIANRITFYYPFRFQKFTYKKEDILGFRYKYLNGKVNYKSLKFRTKGGNRTFSISDFETSNLRELEKLSLICFDLRAGKEFMKLTDREKRREIEISKGFDYEQAKDIRLNLGILIFFLTAIISVLTYQIMAGKLKNVSGVIISIVIMLIINILTGKRFLQIHERIKGSAQQKL